MLGSFTPDSAEKFLQLMREEGYETSDLPKSSGLQNFSESGASSNVAQGGAWGGNVADLNEFRGEYIENYDYTRCVRPNGTAYGTKGKCRKGTEEDKEYTKREEHYTRNLALNASRFDPKLEKRTSLGELGFSSVSKLSTNLKRAKSQGYKYIDYSHVYEDHSGLLKFKKKGEPKQEVTLSIKQLGGHDIDRTIKNLKKLHDKGFTDIDYSKVYEDGSGVVRLVKPYKEDFSEEPHHDYTRCVRPNGTVYGTGGQCRKGTQAEKEEHDALSQLQSMLPKGEKIVTSSGRVFGSEPKELSGQHLANMMTQHHNIRSNVAAEHGGQIRTKAAKAQLAQSLKKAGVPDGPTIKAALEKQRKQEGRPGKAAAAQEQLDSAKKKLMEISDQIDKVVRSGGRVGLNTPLSRQLKAQAALVKELKAKAAKKA